MTRAVIMWSSSISIGYRELASILERVANQKIIQASLLDPDSALIAQEHLKGQPVQRLQSPCAQLGGDAESSTPGSRPTERKDAMPDAGDSESLVRCSACCSTVSGRSWGCQRLLDTECDYIVKRSRSQGGPRAFETTNQMNPGRPGDPCSPRLAHVEGAGLITTA